LCRIVSRIFMPNLVEIRRFKVPGQHVFLLVNILEVPHLFHL
jgi:hypothetical protein